MMGDKIQIVIPTIGESISEGTIGRWFFNEGDIVKKDQALLEVDSDKATLEVPASASGKLSILIPAGKIAKVGSAVGMIEIVNGGAETSSSSSSKPSKTIGTSASKKTGDEPTVIANPQPIAMVPASKSLETPFVPAPSEQIKSLSPSKRKQVRSGQLRPDAPGSTYSFLGPQGEEIRKPMTSLRKRVAERLLESQQSTATLTTFNEVDMTKVNAVRAALKDSFQSRFGVKLGFMSLFSKAVISALKHYPEVGARIEGTDIVYPQFVNLGIAVSTERGLVVPIVRNAERLSCADLEKQIALLAEKARDAKLSIQEMQGGSFTITNGGIFGSLLSTPILNPPQSGILGMHKIEMRPMAIEKSKGKFEVEVRPMMYVALSYDHRLIDGATSVGFLVKVKEFLENLTEDQALS